MPFFKNKDATNLEDIINLTKDRDISEIVYKDSDFEVNIKFNPKDVQHQEKSQITNEPIENFSDYENDMQNEVMR